MQDIRSLASPLEPQWVEGEKSVPTDILPALAIVPLLIGAAVGFSNPAPRPKHIPRVAEVSALLSLALAIAATAALALGGPSASPPLGLHGAGLSVRLDAVSAAMLLLVTFIGWIVLRFAATYLDGEARQGPSSAGSA